MKKITLIMYLVSFNFMLAQVLVDGTTYTGEEIIENVLIGNPNFPASNFTSSTGSNFGSENGIGFFTAMNTDLPFDQGIVLSTGNVNNVSGPNTSILSEGNNNWYGDVDLESAVGLAIGNTYNASILEFDFLAQVNSVSLEFLFASEEYGSFECISEDAFAFLLTDLVDGITYNLAIIPSTNTPISVANIRGGANVNCLPVNESFFGRYNYSITDTSIPSINEVNSPINLNGQTETFIHMGNLIVGRNYHVKIVIADAIDTLNDSALFFRNGSFGVVPRMEQEPVDLIVDDTDGNGSSVFNLRDNEVLMIGGIDTSVYSFDFTYHTSFTDAEAGINAIANPETYTNISDPEEIYVRMKNSYTDLGVTSSFKITTDAALLSLDEFELNEIIFHPNPVLDELIVDSKTSKVEKIEIYTVNGLLVTSINNIESSTNKISFSNLPNGMYLVKVISKKGNVYKRIIK